MFAEAVNAAIELGHRHVVVTSGEDGTHMPGSRHPSGDALDLRTRHLTISQQRAFRLAVLRRLGPEYQAVLERPGKPGQHLHVEYDPPKILRTRRDDGPSERGLR
jgi:hypothetical protein